MIWNPDHDKSPARDGARARHPLRVVAANRREALLLVIASGKGGTGKSFLATNLAVAMSNRGLSVTLLDCDFGLANDHLLLGVNPKLSAQHIFGGLATMEEVRVRTPYGPYLVPGGSGVSQLGDLTAADLLHFSRGMARLADTEDVLIMDASAGISPQGVLTLLAAQQVLLVTNPEIAALTDAYALVKCLAQHQDCPRISVVVNRVRHRGQGEATFQKLAEVSRQFVGCGIHYLGEVPENAKVTQLRLSQAPIVVSQPACKAAKAVQGILDRMALVDDGVGQQVVPASEALAPRFRRFLSLGQPLR
ncbi:MAG: nucleotide-binding protein [Planctomycetota bacterium]|jgi:flagellar biosynthesis protein FlhG